MLEENEKKIFQLTHIPVLKTCFNYTSPSSFYISLMTGKPHLQSAQSLFINIMGRQRNSRSNDKLIVTQ